MASWENGYRMGAAGQDDMGPNYLWHNLERWTTRANKYWHNHGLKILGVKWLYFLFFIFSWAYDWVCVALANLYGTSPKTRLRSSKTSYYDLWLYEVHVCWDLNWKHMSYHLVVTIECGVLNPSMHACMEQLYLIAIKWASNTSLYLCSTSSDLEITHSLCETQHQKPHIQVP